MRMPKTTLLRLAALLLPVVLFVVFSIQIGKYQKGQILNNDYLTVYKEIQTNYGDVQGWMALVPGIFTSGQFSGALDPQKTNMGQWLAFWNDKVESHEHFSFLSDNVAKLDAQYSQLFDAVKTVMRLHMMGDTLQAIQTYNMNCQMALKAFKESIDSISLQIGDTVTENVAEGSSILSNIRILFIVAIISLIVSLIMLLLSGKGGRVSGGNVVVGHIQDIIDGNRTIKDHIDPDQAGGNKLLAETVNNLLDKISDTLNMFQQNTILLKNFVDEFKSSSTELAAGSEEQAAQAGDVAASVEEMTAAILQNSHNATDTAKLAEEANKKADSGSAAMKTTQIEMDEIVVSTEKTGEIVKSLAGRADQIGQIIQVIEEIADQTNLLALNAAIEAARAGEQGRGFAVVADEVRKLAERTTKATKEISDTIGAIQNDTREASDAMSNAYTVVNKGKESTANTEEILHDIVNSVTRAMDMIRQIATATEEMSAGAEEIAKNVSSISKVAENSSKSMGQMGSVADQLEVQITRMNDTLEKF